MPKEIKQCPRRIGKFKVTREVITQDWRLALKVFSKCVVVAVTWRFDGVGEYVAYSPFFDEIEEGQEPPEYECHIAKNGRKISVELKRL